MQTALQPVRWQLACATAAVVIGLAPVLYAATGPAIDTYIGPATGDYSTASNWSLGFVPTNGNNGELYNVIIDGNTGQNSTVTSTISPTIDSLTLNSGDILNVSGNSNFSVGGDAGSSVVDNGHIVLNSNQANTSVFTFDSPATLSGTGTLTLNADGQQAQLNSGSGVTFTQASGHTIDGQGTINATFINDGTVNADVSGKTLTVASSNVTNTGTVEATTGTLQINGVTLDNTGGTIAGTGGTVQIFGSAVSGGTLSSSNGAAIEVQNATFGGGATIAAGTAVNVDGNSNLAVSGTSLTDNGHIVLNSNQTNTSVLTFNNSATLNGTGTLTLHAPGGQAVIRTGSGQTFTQASGHTIDGQGTINATFINNGTVSADVTAQMLTVNGTATNNGTFLATGGGTLSVLNGSITNFSGTTLTGGTYEVDANSTLALNTPGITTLAASVVLSGTPTTFSDITPLNTIATGGSLTLKNGASFTTLAGLSNSGTVTITAATVSPAAPASELIINSGTYAQTAGLTQVDGKILTGLTTLTGGTVAGTGIFIAGDFNNTGGIVSPGDGGPGLLTITGDPGNYTQGSGGTLDIEVAGLTAGSQYDVLDVGSVATLGGTLDVSLLDGFVPLAGSTYTILTAGGISGTFSTVDLPTGFSLTYTPTSVILNGTAVPEPATLGLLAMAAGGLLRRRDR